MLLLKTVECLATFLRGSRTGTIKNRNMLYKLGRNALVLEEMNASNAANRINVWGVGGLVSTGGTATASRLFPLADAQGTTRFLTDSSGQIVQSYSYSPYGQVAAASSATTTPYLYTGENLDQETGLEYLRARYYDPATGRFGSRDPVSGMPRCKVLLINFTPKI